MKNFQNRSEQQLKKKKNIPKRKKRKKERKIIRLHLWNKKGNKTCLITRAQKKSTYRVCSTNKEMKLANLLSFTFVFFSEAETLKKIRKRKKKDGSVMQK